MKEMVSKLTYNLLDDIINPKYIGIVREYTPDNYEIGIYNETPSIVNRINDYFSTSGIEIEEAELFECYTSNTISTIYFDDLDLDERTMLYFFFCVTCKEDTDIVFTIESHAIQRLWLNKKMVTLCGHGKRQIHTLHLSAGNNVFCFQQHDSYCGIRTTFRIQSLDTDRKNDLPLTEGNLYYEEGLVGVRVKYQDEFQHNKDLYRFIIYPIDCVNLYENTDFKMSIIDHVSGKILYEQICYFYKLYSIPTSSFHYHHEDIFNYLDVVFNYLTIDGVPREIHTYMFLSQHKDYISPVKERAKFLLNRDLGNDEKYYLQYVIALNDCGDTDNIHKWENIEKCLTHIESGSYPKYLYSSGEKVICFHSDIDDTIDYYTVTLPKNYNRDHKYPLLIINNVLQGTWLSSYFSRVKKLKVIAVDFSGRGITMGSYVGDAAYNEIYEDVLERFNIDEKKICVMGHSNGGFATWNQAQVTPDRYLAIYPAVSRPNVDAIMNLSNQCVRYLSSESENIKSKIAEEIEIPAKKYLRDYKLLWIKKFCHGLFGQVQMNEKLIISMLNQEKEDYPNEINFYTNKNRYLKSYWIKIHSIETGETFSRVNARINNNVIEVSVENVAGITITVPPQVNKTQGKIILNGVTYQINGHKTIKLIKEKNEYVLCDEEAKCDICKGTGIIDPYLGDIRVISFLDDTSQDIVKNFCSPSTNGFYGSIYVNYPILNYSDISEFPKTNLIMLDSCTGCGSVIDLIKNNARIKTDNKGYSYFNETYSGKYLVMQIINHPYDTSKSILYVNTNNSTLYNNCIFTRKLTLPSYSNGFHPYLNSEALIYTGDKYLSILDYGCDISEISPTTPAC